MRLIWATRGRSWGFRFIRTAGAADPLVSYEAAFAGTDSEESSFRRDGDVVAFKFPDPLGRKDRSGRVIPHAFVITNETSGQIQSLEDGFRTVWPEVSAYYAEIWDRDAAPESVSE